MSDYSNLMLYGGDESDSSISYMMYEGGEGDEGSTNSEPSSESESEPSSDSDSSSESESESSSESKSDTNDNSIFGGDEYWFDSPVHLTVGGNITADELFGEGSLDNIFGGIRFDGGNGSDSESDNGSGSDDGIIETVTDESDSGLIETFTDKKDADVIDLTEFTSGRKNNISGGSTNDTIPEALLNMVSTFSL